MTKASYRLALIPEEYGGLSLPMSAAAAILEKTHRCGCNAAACHAQMRAAELMLHDAIRVYEEGGNPWEEANLAKLLAADAQWAEAEACLQTHGGFGFAEEYDVERTSRQAGINPMAPISIHLIFKYVAEHVRTMPRSH